jgi:predicted TIM-barrel fold metal-dependent hydrolase
MAGGRKITGADVRARLGHPVVDGDSHILEHGPALDDFLRQVAGADMVRRLHDYRLQVPQGYRDIWWSRPSGAHTIDLATSMLPKLYRKRFDELGVDYSILYSSVGLGAMHVRDDELRQALHRALNTMYAAIFAEVGDRMTPSAVIPTHTPEEAIAELDYAVNTLGLKAITVNSEVRRPVPEVAREAPHLAKYTSVTYSIAHDPLYDYDPFWKRCVELKVAPACHTKTAGPGTTRNSPTSFVFNHLGGFASGSEFLCRSVFLGGIPHRFPELNFQFLEGNSAWALGLYNDICEHWEKRNVKALKRNLNPHDLRADVLIEAFEKYGDAHLRADRIRANPHFMSSDLEIPERELDEFKACGLKRLDDIKAVFEKNFFFGCEADDRLASCAFKRELHHGGARLNATLSSDYGHWDVVDMTQVLPEAYAALEDGLFTPENFRDFAFANTVRCLGGMNPDFFKGTIIETEAAKVLGETKRPARSAAE